MKHRTIRIITSFLIVCTMIFSQSIFAFAAEKEEVTPKSYYIWMAVVTGNAVNLRTEASESSVVKGLLYAGDEILVEDVKNLDIQGDNRTWVFGLVTTGANQHESGYVAKEFVRIEAITIP